MGGTQSVPLDVLSVHKEGKVSGWLYSHYVSLLTPRVTVRRGDLFVGLFPQGGDHRSSWVPATRLLFEVESSRRLVEGSIFTGLLVTGGP